MELLESPFVIPLGAIVTVGAVVIVESVKKLREKELEVQRKLRLREMEPPPRIKELDVAFERARA